MRSQPELAQPWAAADRAQLRRRVAAWYAKSGRRLPWRESSDPYRVWISEIMLQQTTVTAVVPYYERFLRRFPDVTSLAAASEQDVLAQWEGLGYYSRGRNLHRTAQQIVRQQNGRFPRSLADLQALPGVGRYTAGAIASFAFGDRAPILEANTLRLYARLLGYRGDPRSASGQRLLWDFAEVILPQKAAGAFNQAVMDLGATVCRPEQPDCAACPLQKLCRGFQDGLQHVIPPPKPQPAVTVLHEVALAVRQGQDWLLRRRGAKERWGGLWDFPRLPLDPSEMKTARSGPVAHEDTDCWLGAVERMCGVRASLAGFLSDATYSFTRYRVQLRRLVADRSGGQLHGAEEFRWASLDELGDWPLTGSARTFARALAGDELRFLKNERRGARLARPKSAARRGRPERQR